MLREEKRKEEKRREEKRRDSTCCNPFKNHHN
jgi:hypothetical protein